MLNHYANNVIKIAKAQNVDIDTACNKFIADVRAGKALEYNTNGDGCADFAAIKTRFDKLTEDDQSAEIAELKSAVHAAVFPGGEAK